MAVLLMVKYSVNVGKIYTIHLQELGKAAKLGKQLVACDMIMCTDCSVHQGNPTRLRH